MGVKHGKRSKNIASRIPYPELPLPSKFRKIKRSPVEPELEDAPEPEQLKPVPAPRLRKPKKRRPTAKVRIQDPIVGGELEPEEPKIKDKGDHVIEDLDLSDYQ